MAGTRKEVVWVPVAVFGTDLGMPAKRPGDDRGASGIAYDLVGGQDKLWVDTLRDALPCCRDGLMSQTGFPRFLGEFAVPRGCGSAAAL
jgi:hypothetical protein